MMIKILLLVLGVTLTLVFGMVVTRRHYQRRALDRGPISFEQFLALLPEDVDRQIARKVHAAFVSDTGVPDYPLAPTDELIEDFLIEEEVDFEDLFEMLMAECDVDLPEGSGAHAKTVEDVIVLLSKYRSRSISSDP